MFASGVQLSHFVAMLIFAMLVSVALGCLVRHTTAGRIRYAIWSFALFIIVGVGFAWLMFPFSR
jgi:hypothetical protein